MLTGPLEYVPPIQVEVVERRKAIPLDENEGIYVRDIQTGRVRVVRGESYLLKPNEELWKKEVSVSVCVCVCVCVFFLFFFFLSQTSFLQLSKLVDQLLSRDRADSEQYEREKTRCVTFRAPHNSAVQIYDYKEKKARVVFGPELIMLGPDEQFTVLSLSGDQPKRAGVIQDLCIRLGPDFMTDIVIVETADHARLSLKLSYNWHFDGMFFFFFFCFFFLSPFYSPFHTFLFISPFHS
jgi:major vault protein